MRIRTGMPVSALPHIPLACTCGVVAEPLGQILSLREGIDDCSQARGDRPVSLVVVEALHVTEALECTGSTSVCSASAQKALEDLDCGLDETRVASREHDYSFKLTHVPHHGDSAVDPDRVLQIGVGICPATAADSVEQVRVQRRDRPDTTNLKVLLDGAAAHVADETGPAAEEEPRRLGDLVVRVSLGVERGGLEQDGQIGLPRRRVHAEEPRFPRPYRLFVIGRCSGEVAVPPREAVGHPLLKGWWRPTRHQTDSCRCSPREHCRISGSTGDDSRVALDTSSLTSGPPPGKVADSQDSGLSSS